MVYHPINKEVWQKCWTSNMDDFMSFNVFGQKQKVEAMKNLQWYMNCMTDHPSSKIRGGDYQLDIKYFDKLKTLALDSKKYNNKNPGMMLPEDV